MVGTIDMSGALRSFTESIRTLIATAWDLALRQWRVIGLLALLVVVALAGYAAWPRTTPATTAVTASTPGWSRQCVAGVSYLQFTSGVSVGHTDDGDPLFRRMVTTHSDRWRPGWRESAVG